ncbi:MAG: LysR family transcriptional regulator [Candidatus Rokubacteria bacterium]|nr:LysR family transcriptional regulator [Candidatus Rokubacteria bacterium]
MEPKIKVWVTFEAVKFGDGRAALLDLIDSLGSISQAAARAGMSYRNLWGYLRELEAAAGFRFLERRRGGGPRGGTRLTGEGRAFLRRYRRFRRAMDLAATRHFRRSFPER